MLKIPELSERDKVRYWLKVNKNSPVMSVGLDSCWEWTGQRSGGGKYRQFHEQRRATFGITIEPKKVKTYSASRIAWFLATGEDPAELHVLHRCDNPGCVNPAHLFLGTHAENMLDKAQKGRVVSPLVEQQRGESNGQAKLTDEIVLGIRNRYAAGELQKALAKEHKVSRALVSLIVNKKIWAHI